VHELATPQRAKYAERDQQQDSYVVKISHQGAWPNYPALISSYWARSLKPVVNLAGAIKFGVLLSF
jgi:hypothetical protein